MYDEGHQGEHEKLHSITCVTVFTALGACTLNANSLSIVCCSDVCRGFSNLYLIKCVTVLIKALDYYWQLEEGFA